MSHEKGQEEVTKKGLFFYLYLDLNRVSTISNEPEDSRGVCGLTDCI